MGHMRPIELFNAAPLSFKKLHLLEASPEIGSFHPFFSFFKSHFKNEIETKGRQRHWFHYSMSLADFQLTLKLHDMFSTNSWCMFICPSVTFQNPMWPISWKVCRPWCWRGCKLSSQLLSFSHMQEASVRYQQPLWHCNGQTHPESQVSAQQGWDGTLKIIAKGGFHHLMASSYSFWMKVKILRGSKKKCQRAVNKRVNRRLNCIFDKYDPDTAADFIKVNLTDYYTTTKPLKLR